MAIFIASGPGPELRQGDLVGALLERNLDWQADAHPLGRTADQVGEQSSAFLELDEDDGVRDLGGEPGMVDLVHDVEADDRTTPGGGDPLGVAAEAATANLARREPA